MAALSINTHGWIHVDVTICLHILIFMVVTYWTRGWRYIILSWTVFSPTKWLRHSQPWLCSSAWSCQHCRQSSVPRRACWWYRSKSVSSNTCVVILFSVFNSSLWLFFLSSWDIDNTTDSVSYIISGVNSSAEMFDKLWFYRYEPCPVEGCPQLPDPNDQPLEDKYVLNYAVPLIANLGHSFIHL